VFDDTFDNTPHHPILTEPEPTGFSTHEVEFHDGHRTDSYDFDGDGHVDLRTIDFDNDGRPEVTARDTDDDQVKGPKALWRAVTLINFVGPLSYFALGRR